MSIADKYRPQFSYEDYLLWEGRWELIDGMPYAMSPAPTHQRINGKLWSLIDVCLRSHCHKCEVFLPIDWKINENTVLQPDVLIVCKKIEKKYLDFAPMLVVEIVSPSTEYKDRHEKFELYEQEGVLYYLIVDPQFKKIDMHVLTEGKYILSTASTSTALFTFPDGCSFAANLENIWE